MKTTASREAGRHVPTRDLQGANFRHANLKGADFTEAYLLLAHFGDAKLEFANLWGADLEDAKGLDAYIAVLENATGDERTRLPKDVKRPEHWPHEMTEPEE
ncbi:pentapeptide repeat-containing protein [Paraburkholderia sp. UCT31]|uniref:pentapeptide repeat-containing protein n=1 Tax=Paraburkholderia sp. UCT31 TaxID=2615209 RepID=UPI0016560217|nr:pentapeptide repeat-containing protein [Paraburkholderia sp. UCT31]